MKLALAVWNGRISPVFDTSRQLLVIDAEEGKVVSRRDHEIETDDPLQKAARLAECGVEALVCGAVSRLLAQMIEDRGIQLVPFVAGEVEAIITAFLAGSLPNPDTAMPGCCGRRVRGRQGRGRGCRWRGGRR
jgi:predicted Fe-Mo cluster-binding NifX family protein